MAEPVYRRVGEMTADELLAHLTTTPQHQISLFVRMGGDPNDHDYALLSFLTQQLRDRGIPVLSSQARGLWLDPSFDLSAMPRQLELEVEHSLPRVAAVAGASIKEAA